METQLIINTCLQYKYENKNKKTFYYNGNKKKLMFRHKLK